MIVDVVERKQARSRKKAIYIDVIQLIRHALESNPPSKAIITCTRSPKRDSRSCPLVPHPLLTTLPDLDYDSRAQPRAESSRTPHVSWHQCRFRNAARIAKAGPCKSALLA